MAKQTKRPTQSRAGAKMLIAVASIGCTLGGWMYFANTAPADTSSAAAIAEASVQVASSQWVALPTVVPITDAMVTSNVVVAQSQNTTQQSASTALRSVTVAPVAISQSSR